MKFIGQQAKIKIKEWLPKWLPTILYVVFTICMVWIMSKQLQLNYEQFQQNNRPYLFIKQYTFGDGGVGVSVENIGNIPARVEVKKLCYSRDNGSYKEYCEEKYEKQSQEKMYVYPKSEGNTILVRKVKGKEVLNLIATKGYFNMVVEFDYWGIGDREMKNTFFFKESTKFVHDSDAPSGVSPTIIERNAN